MANQRVKNQVPGEQEVGKELDLSGKIIDNFIKLNMSGTYKGGHGRGSE